MPNYFSKPDALVDAVRAVLTGQPTETQEDIERRSDVKMVKVKLPDGRVVMKKSRPEIKIGETNKNDDSDDGEGLDAVQPKAVKKKFKDRKDKDIDNDGDTDSSDEYLHKRRKAVSKAVKEAVKENKTDDDEDDDEDDKPKAKAKNGEDKDTSKEDEENGKKNKVGGKKDTIDTEPVMKDQRMTSEMTDAQEKKREEIVLSMKKKMPDFKKKYGDRAKDVIYATATKMAMKEGFELTGEQLDEITKPPFDPPYKKVDPNAVHKDKFGNVIKKKNVARNLAKQGMDSVKEEDELEELSKKTLGSYASKASDARGHKDLPTKKVDNRYAGVSKAVDKMTKEEVEIDEKMNSTTKKVIRKMAKKGTLPVRDMVKQAMSNPKNMKEEDDLDELSKKKLGQYVKKASVAAADAADRKHNPLHRGKGQHFRTALKRIKGIDKAVNKMTKEEVEVDEARGRPRKDGTKSDTDDREQIQMQLRKSISLRGLKDVVFDDGKKVKVSARDARDVLGKLDAIKAPRERQNAVVHIAKSHKNLVDFAKGKAGEMDPEQRRKDAANSPFKKK